jgi:hypothetical protein
LSITRLPDAVSTQVEAPVMSFGDRLFTMWDRLELAPRRDMTLKTFLAALRKQYGLKVRTPPHMDDAGGQPVSPKSSAD